MQGLIFRVADVGDAEAISSLIVRSQREFCFHEYTADGQTLMLRVCGVEALKRYLERGDVYFVAEQGSAVIGVAGIRNNDHLTHNFVDAAWHRRGVSKRLWALVRDECVRRGNLGSFNLRASTHAIPVYEKWGFIRTGPTDQQNGITSTPMALHRAERKK